MLIQVLLWSLLPGIWTHALCVLQKFQSFHVFFKKIISLKLPLSVFLVKNESYDYVKMCL